MQSIIFGELTKDVPKTRCTAANGDGVDPAAAFIR
jgi:hypothetical protein